MKLLAVILVFALCSEALRAAAGGGDAMYRSRSLKLVSVERDESGNLNITSPFVTIRVKPGSGTSVETPIGSVDVENGEVDVDLPGATQVESDNNGTRVEVGEDGDIVNIEVDEDGVNVNVGEDGEIVSVETGENGTVEVDILDLLGTPVPEPEQENGKRKK